MLSSSRLGFMILIWLLKVSCEKDIQGYIMDDRDGMKYEWVQIGDQKWFQDNLA